MNNQEILAQYLPAGAIDYCQRMWNSYGFTLKIKKSRQTKLGDYRFLPKENKHIISVNSDLNRYSFLITYLHEIAHLLVQLKHGSRVEPHGKEWKRAFQSVLLPVLNSDIFPDEILRPLAAYIKNPKASSCNDHQLYMSLSRYDVEQKYFLEEIPALSTFVFGKKTFRREALRRTRYVCQELATGRRYLISKSARIELIKD